MRNDPAAGVDFTWERKWRYCGGALTLDPKHTLVVVPSGGEAFDLMFDHAEWKASSAAGIGRSSSDSSGHFCNWLADSTANHAGRSTVYVMLTGAMVVIQ